MFFFHIAIPIKYANLLTEDEKLAFFRKMIKEEFDPKTKYVDFELEKIINDSFLRYSKEFANSLKIKG